MRAFGKKLDDAGIQCGSDGMKHRHCCAALSGLDLTQKAGRNARVMRESFLRQAAFQA